MLDATAYTASMLVDANPSGAVPFGEVNIGRQLFFFTNPEGSPGGGATSLWVTDGTAGGTHDLADNLSLAQNNEQFAFAVNGNLLFFADTSGGNGYPELWISDGTAAGTQELADISQEGANPPAVLGYSLMAGNELHFMLYGHEGDAAVGDLWESDGTAAGTMPVLDPAGFPVGVLSGDEQVTLGDTLYMIAFDQISGPPYGGFAQSFLSVSDGETAQQDGWGSDSDNPVIVGQAGNSILYENAGPGQNGDLGGN